MKLLLCLLALSVSASAQLYSGVLPDSRATTAWTTAGVEGGIPSATWQQCGTTIAAGATAATINTALSNCTANHYVLLGAGTFTVSGLHIGNSSVALRGSGADQTILNIASDGPTSCFISLSTAISFCSGSNTQHVVNWTAGYSQGTTQLTLSSVTSLTVGTPMILEQLDDASDGWPATGDLYVCENTSNNCSNQGGGSDSFYPETPGRSNMQIVRVTAINQGGCGATCVTINPAITLPNYRSGQTPHAVYYNNGVYQTSSGVENLSVNYTGVQVGIRMVYCDNCWISGVRVVNTSSSAGSDVHDVMPVLSFHVTIRNNYMYGDQCGVGCILNYQNMPMVSGSLLWENNIMQGPQAALIPNGPYSNSVFAYNFFTGRPDSAVLLHNAGEMMDLVEGNVMNGWVGDIDHGTHFFETLFRNAIVSYRFATGAGSINTAVAARTNNRFINVVGNVMGHSHWTTYETNQAQGDNSIYEVGWQGNISGVPVTNDANVKRTLMRWGNWDNVTNATRWCSPADPSFASAPCSSTSEVPTGITNFPNPDPSPLVGHTLPASFYYSSKPTWWPASKAWPPIGPDVSSGNLTSLGGHANTNPAADCYLNVMAGPTDGSGNPLTFNATTCYPLVVATVSVTMKGVSQMSGSAVMK